MLRDAMDVRPALPLILSLGLFGAGPAFSEETNVTAPIDRMYSDLFAVYRDLHEHPELSFQEEKTAAKLAKRLRALGFEVTERVGGHGLVGVLRNGAGPVVLLRTDMDGLPVQESTGLPYASRASAKDDGGNVVHVMHACGHDVHMTAWLGAAEILSRSKATWRGTLIMMGQPAEERVAGARAMLRDGLLERFPKASYALAVHVSAAYPAGAIAVRAGPLLAGVDSVDVTIFGKGGHGAVPNLSVDPIVIAARVVLAIQTIVSRENDPLEPAVITVGSIHGGTKHNIIPDEVKLQLTVRAFDDAIRARMIESIRRIVKAEAEAASAPKPPVVAVSESASATINDPSLTGRIADALRKKLGPDRIIEARALMGSEDFSELGRAGVPSVFLWVGATKPELLSKPKDSPRLYGVNHASNFAPDIEPALKSAIAGLVEGAKALLARP
jgi:amidohydrolase